MPKARQYWSDEELSHFKFLFNQGTDNDRIIKELKEKFGTDRTANTLAQKRLTDVFRAARAREISLELLAALSEEGETVSGNDAAKSKVAVNIDMSLFKPVPVTTLAKGNIVIYPKIGPMRCTGLQKSVVAGYKVETYVLEEIFRGRTGSTVNVMKSRVMEKNMRFASSKEAMDTAMTLLEQEFKGSKLPPKVNNRQPYLEDKLQSGSLAAMCELVGRAFRTEHAPAMDKEFGNRALAFLSAEYAAVFNISLAAAKDIVAEHSGQKAMTQRNLDMDGPAFP